MRNTLPRVDVGRRTASNANPSRPSQYAYWKGRVQTVRVSRETGGGTVEEAPNTGVHRCRLPRNPYTKDSRKRVSFVYAYWRGRRTAG
jgi:hypothetical protein